jgi:outer membrane protein assembly factor BamA
LRPRSWRLDAGPGTFGTALAISTSASDAVGHHGLAATLLLETERGDPQGAIGYAYQRLPFDLSMSFRRSVAPVLYRPDRPLFTRQHLSLTTGIGYSLPGEFENNAFSLSYTLSRIDGSLPLPVPTDPDALVGGEPVRGQLGSVHLGWSYSNAEAYLWSASAERGFTLALSVDVAAPPLASDYTLYIVSYAAAEYFPMPWARHHTLALRQSSATSSGNYPFRGIFYTGGVIEAPIFRPFTLGEYQGPFVLRGYPAFSFSGSQYHLFNAEYRFPILNLDRGLSTLPLFVHRISGNLFADYGGAFNELDLDRWWSQFHLGVGAELWLDFTMGYVIGANVRIGHARGVADPAAALGGQTYVVLAVPF